MSLMEFLELLDQPRQAVWNFAQGAGDLLSGDSSLEDVLRMAPGAIGGLGTMGLAATGLGLPAAIGLGSVMGGVTQQFNPVKPKRPDELIRGWGLDPESGEGITATLGTSILTDPLTWALPLIGGGAVAAKMNPSKFWGGETGANSFFRGGLSRAEGIESIPEAKLLEDARLAMISAGPAESVRIANSAFDDATRVNLSASTLDDESWLAGGAPLKAEAFGDAAMALREVGRGTSLEPARIMATGRGGSATMGTAREEELVDLLDWQIKQVGGSAQYQNDLGRLGASPFSYRLKPEEELFSDDLARSVGILPTPDQITDELLRYPDQALSQMLMSNPYQSRKARSLEQKSRVIEDEAHRAITNGPGFANVYGSDSTLTAVQRAAFESAMKKAKALDERATYLKSSSEAMFRDRGGRSLREMIELGANDPIGATGFGLIDPRIEQMMPTRLLSPEQLAGAANPLAMTGLRVEPEVLRANNLIASLNSNLNRSLDWNLKKGLLDVPPEMFGNSSAKEFFEVFDPQAMLSSLSPAATRRFEANLGGMDLDAVLREIEDSYSKYGPNLIATHPGNQQLDPVRAFLSQILGIG